jgi:hypothetical protein
MGQKLTQLYDHVTKEGGVVAKMRLAMITGIPSVKADTAEDSKENIAKFVAGIKEITGKTPPGV